MNIPKQVDAFVTVQHGDNAFSNKTYPSCCLLSTAGLPIISLSNEEKINSIRNSVVSSIESMTDFGSEKCKLISTFSKQPNQKSAIGWSNAKSFDKPKESIDLQSVFPETQQLRKKILIIPPSTQTSTTISNLTITKTSFVKSSKIETMENENSENSVKVKSKPTEKGKTTPTKSKPKEIEKVQIPIPKKSPQVVEKSKTPTKTTTIEIDKVRKTPPPTTPPVFEKSKELEKSKPTPTNSITATPVIEKSTKSTTKTTTTTTATISTTISTPQKNAINNKRPLEENTSENSTETTEPVAKKPKIPKPPSAFTDSDEKLIGEYMTKNSIECARKGEKFKPTIPQLKQLAEKLSTKKGGTREELLARYENKNKKKKNKKS